MFKNKPDATSTDSARVSTSSAAILSTLIFAVAAASVLYRLLVLHRLEQTAALFIGLPTVLAILVATRVHPERLTGMIVKAMALMMLVSGIFLGEGFICILMAAPLFFAVAIVIAVITETVKAVLKKGTDSRLVSCIALLALGPMSLEGVMPKLSFPRDEEVVVSRKIAVTPEAFARSLASTPQFDDAALPRFFELGFPLPLEVAGSGLQPGDDRSILFGGGEGEPGRLILEIVSSTKTSAHFRAVSDTSHIAHWLTWQEAVVEWGAASDHTDTTIVTWTFRYRRELDPAWYFGPWERYAVSLAANHLIDTFAATATSGL